MQSLIEKCVDVAKLDRDHFDTVFKACLYAPQPDSSDAVLIVSLIFIFGLFTLFVWKA
jgi:hypothetical protein